jgi:hypothetical protein
VNWRETANLIRFLTEDCCADMHTRLAPSKAPVAAPSVSGAGALCCGQENARRRAHYSQTRKDSPNIDNGMPRAGSKEI